ncbi:MAG: hypothetical protein PHI18_01365, partial [bacterium]|nr:hypothetical protein [bacterium]
FDWIQAAKNYPMCDGVDTYHWSTDHTTIAQRYSEIGKMTWNSGPYVIHGPAEYTARPDSVVIRVEAWSDDFIGISSATITSCRLFYRLLPGGNWSAQTMTPAGTDAYTATVRSLRQDATAIEYYITVQDSRNLSATAPADAPTNTFLSALPVEGGTSERLNYEEVPYRTSRVFGHTVIEWNRRDDARWFEVHRGEQPVFRDDSPTLVSRQGPEFPRLLFFAENNKAGESDLLRVFAILDSDGRRKAENQVSRK